MTISGHTGHVEIHGMEAGRYVVIITQVRADTAARDETRRPERVICRCGFDDREQALWTWHAWIRQPTVQAGRERVKVIAFRTR